MPLRSEKKNILGNFCMERMRQCVLTGLHIAWGGKIRDVHADISLNVTKAFTNLILFIKSDYL